MAVISGTFRGVQVNTLALLIQQATATGQIVLMKSVNNINNIGKTPELVLAEHLVMALHDSEPEVIA